MMATQLAVMGATQVVNLKYVEMELLTPAKNVMTVTILRLTDVAQYVN